jgi:DNA-binding NarL/FixJ family response regulator
VNCRAQSPRESFCDLSRQADFPLEKTRHNKTQAPSGPEALPAAASKGGATQASYVFAAELIRRDSPNSEVLIATHFESLDLARFAAQTGVRAYIAKSRIATDLEKAIEAASRHQSS